MILIYCKSISNRIQYAAEIIFNTILLADFKITTDENEFITHQGPKITYGKNINLPTDIKLEADELLFQQTISKQNIDIVLHKDYKGLFPVSSGDLPFDPLATTFYLVSRYEEYLPSQLDSHKRYKPDNSIAFQRNFLKQPIVNYIALDLKSMILEKHQEYFFKPIPYNFVPTLDIDNAYAYKNKGIARITYSLINLLLRFKLKKIWKRVRVHLGIDEDPYDTYAKQMAIHDQYNVRPRYFFSVGDYNFFDRNVSYRKKPYRQLIKKIYEKYDVGVHPSYNANYNEKKVLKEKSRLEEITGDKIATSRQHYLRIKFPETYRNLIKCGISHDYTMGYSSQIGFRASICTPYPFYDLVAETRTNLIIHPFVAMDSTFKYYLKVRASEIPYQIRPIYEVVKQLGGELVIIFHNESLGSHKIWKNWGNTYESIIKMCVK